MLKLQYAPAPFWSIVGQNQLKYEFLMLVLVKYIILKKIKFEYYAPLILLDQTTETRLFQL